MASRAEGDTASSLGAHFRSSAPAPGRVAAATPRAWRFMFAGSQGGGASSAAADSATLAMESAVPLLRLPTRNSAKRGVGVAAALTISSDAAISTASPNRLTRAAADTDERCSPCANDGAAAPAVATALQEGDSGGIGGAEESDASRASLARDAAANARSWPRRRHSAAANSAKLVASVGAADATLERALPLERAVPRRDDADTDARPVDTRSLIVRHARSEKPQRNSSVAEATSTRA
jgi:hypothetical protein